jgi:hypothetical protein
VTTFREDEIKNLLTIPYQMRIVMLLLLGHPADGEERETRMPFDRVVSYDHW